MHGRVSRFRLVTVTVARAREARLHVDLSAGAMSIDSDRFVLDDKNASGFRCQSRSVQDGTLPDSVSGKEAKLRISALTWDDLPARIAADGRGTGRPCPPTGRTRGRD